jgi:Zn-dependent protease with chaperone function
LRMKEANPLTIWGRYFRYLYRLLNVIWLIWLPVYSWTNICEILSVTGAHPLLIQLIGLILYFLPPLAVMYLCHLFSRKVYRQVRGTEWSPREVVGKAILSNAFSLMPFFFFLLALNMFAAKSPYAGLVVALAIVCWALFARLASKAFNLSAYAVTSGELRERFFALAERAGVRLRQIYVLPEGQGQMSNAFARSDNAVMLTASLLRHLSRREVDAIMAHEIGHLKEKHPQTAGRVTIITIVVANFVAASAASAIDLQRWTPAIFSLSIAAAMLVTHFFKRGNERHADAIAVNLTGDPEAFITGLARISRLNLMPLHSGGWSESLDTHPATRHRLEDVARCGGISPQRLQELLDAPAALEEERYNVAPLNEAEGKIFSTAFKSKYIFRISWAILAVVVGTPVLLALLAVRLQLQGSLKWAAFFCGLVITFGLYQLIRNFASFWGYASLEQRLRAKLQRSGFGEASRDGLFVGFAPAAEPHSYESYLFWDAGILRLTAEQLCYVGEETRFALRREQIVDIYL